MDKSQNKIFVVTAGVSILGNIKGLLSAFGKLERFDCGEKTEKTKKPEKPEKTEWMEFVESIESDIGMFPPREPHAADTARRLCLLDVDKATEESGSSQERGSDTSDSAVPQLSDTERFARLFDLTPDHQEKTRWLSAELSSLFAEDAPHPRAGDHVVLLASDSDVGVRCARLVGTALVALVGGDLRAAQLGEVEATVTLLSDPASDVQSVEADELVRVFTDKGVTVVTIGGLTADETFAVERSVESIAIALGSAYAAAKAGKRKLILHPIGGYKATIPMFTALAAHLPVKDGVDVEMWSSHEMTTLGLMVPLLRVGVEDRFIRDLQNIKANPDSTTLQLITEGKWRGYAWSEDTQGRYGLTSVGRGILKLFQL